MSETITPLAFGRLELLGDPRRHRIELDAADSAAPDRRMRDQLAHHVLGEVAGHGEADALSSRRSG